MENVFFALSEEERKAVEECVRGIPRKKIREKALSEGNEKRFDYKGYPCAIIRRGVHLCGYVGLSENHKYYGKEGGDIDAVVHGGVTCAEENSGFWVVGFDCAHAGDYKMTSSWDDGAYRDMAYVEREIKYLVDQIA